MGSPQEGISAALERLSAELDQLSTNMRIFKEQYQKIGRFIGQQERLLRASGSK
jgi:hypothetical protein